MLSGLLAYLRIRKGLDKRGIDFALGAFERYQVHVVILCEIFKNRNDRVLGLERSVRVLDVYDDLITAVRIRFLGMAGFVRYFYAVNIRLAVNFDIRFRASPNRVSSLGIYYVLIDKSYNQDHSN